MTATHAERPVGLWILAIVALLLGALGSCGSTLGLVSLAAQDSLIEMQEQLAANDPNPDARELNREINRASLEVAQQWKVPSIIGQVLNVIASFALVIAGILLFRWHPGAPMIFIGAAMLSLLADLVIGGVGFVVQQQTMAAMEEVMAGHAHLGTDPAAQRMMSGVMRASGTFGLCFSLGWLGAKLGFYLGGVFYLRRGPVRQLFGWGEPDDVPAPSRELVVPRFWTAGRVARHERLHAALAERTGAEVVTPPKLTVEVPGLPYPIDFVVDMGTHVSPLSELEGGPGLEARREEALRNLRQLGVSAGIPTDRVVTFVDPNDHGAASALLLPERLGASRTCLVVAPAHDTLILFPDENPALAREARATFEARLAAGDGDAPIPEPVRVSGRGFEPVGWS